MRTNRPLSNFTKRALTTQTNKKTGERRPLQKIMAWALTLTMLLTLIPTFTLPAKAQTQSSDTEINLEADNRDANFTNWSSNADGTIFNITDNVNVVGISHDVLTTGLTFNIPDGVMVYWDASLEVSVFTGSLITLNGDGTFVVGANGYAMLANYGSGNTINATGANMNVIVTGMNDAEYGTVISARGSSIHGTGTNTTVTVEGYGLVANNESSNTRPVINIINNDGTNVYIKDNGSVIAEDNGDSDEALGRGYAIQTSGNVEVSGGEVLSLGTYGRAINLTGSSSTATITGGLVEAEGDRGVAISTATTDASKVANASVVVSGGEVKSVGDYAIRVAGANSEVTVSGGMVSATNGNAIRSENVSAVNPVNVSGGFVFAYGTVIEGTSGVTNVAGDSTPNISSPAVVVAWNDLGVPNPVEGTSMGLIILPEGATAVWAIGENEYGGEVYGIRYKNGGNEGFFEVENISFTPATNYGLLFSLSDAKFYLDYNADGVYNAGTDPEYTGQSDKWNWEPGTPGTLSLIGFVWETPAQNALKIVGGSGPLKLKIEGTNTFRATGEGPATAIEAGGFEITIEGDGTLNAHANPSTQWAHGIHADGLIVNSGTINATAEGGTTAPTARGIYVETGDFIINDGTVNATATGTGANGLYLLNSNLHINGGTLTTQGDIRAIEFNSGSLQPLPNEHTWWANSTSPSNPGGNGTPSTYMPYVHNADHKFVKIQRGLPTFTTTITIPQVNNNDPAGAVNDPAAALHDATVNLPAVAAYAGFTFSEWRVTSGGVAIIDANNADGASFVMGIQNVTIEAIFTASSLTFNPKTLDSGTVGTPYSANVTPATGGSGTYTYSATVPAGLVMNAAGEISGTPNTAVTAQTFTVTATDTITGATADAEYTITIAAQTFAVTVTSAGTGSSGGGWHAVGATVHINAGTPPEGQQFKEWEISPSVTFVNNTSVTTPDAEFTMPAEAVTATAVFEEIPPVTFNLTITAGTGGSITIGASGQYSQGAVINITASENANYTFSHWATSNGGSFGNTNSRITTYTMPGNDTTITAHFTYSSPGNGGNGGNPWTPPPTTPPTIPTQPTIPGTGGDDKINVPVTVNPDTGEVTITPDRETTDKLIEDAKENAGDGQPTVTFDLTGVDDARSATLDTAVAQAFADAGVAVSIMLPGVTITFDPVTLEAIIAIAGLENLSITVEAAVVPMSDLQGMQAAQVRGYETVVNIKVFIDGAKMDVPITINLPYNLKPNENPAAVRVWHMTDDGGALTDLNGVFDTDTGMITFMVSHQSYFVVGYDPVTLWVNVFTDVSETAWYYDAVAFANYHGLFGGYSSGIFGPQDSMTRAMFVKTLWKLEGNPAPGGSAWFTDVAVGTWYHDPVQWAAEQGMVSGVGGGRFAPDRPITRQEMAVMLMNYADFKGFDIPKNREALDFADADSIASWARNAILEMTEAGVINGSNGSFMPHRDATRAEVAQMFRNFLRFVAESGASPTANAAMLFSASASDAYIDRRAQVEMERILASGGGDDEPDE